MNAAEYFEEKGYVYLDNVISKELCGDLTKRLFELKEKGELVQDEQCPLSWSVYGDPALDSILAELAPALSKQLGIELYPTYTYARLYQPGEELKRHIDRPSCEISGTLTLGFDPDSRLWPLYFSKDPDDLIGKPVDIGIGDLVMYRGNELTHWRPKYKGKWQTQVFFHFVDANGPHKDWKYDKRPELGLPAETKNKIPVKKAEEKLLHTPVYYNGVMIPLIDGIMPGASSFNKNFRPELTFTKEECNKVVKLADQQYAAKASVGSDSNGKVDTKIRMVDQYSIPLNKDTQWIFDKIAHAVSIANQEFYKYEIMGITHDLQLLHYKEDDKSFYDWHVDCGSESSSTRKISISVSLTDPSEYEGGDLIINDHGVVINTIKEQGCINMFPSYALHQVTPVTKGERWVIVIWVHGSQRFR